MAGQIRDDSVCGRLLLSTLRCALGGEQRVAVQGWQTLELHRSGQQRVFAGARGQQRRRVRVRREPCPCAVGSQATREVVDYPQAATIRALDLRAHRARDLLR